MPGTITNLRDAVLRSADIRRDGANQFKFVPDDDWRASLAQSLGLQGLRKLRLSGDAGAEGRDIALSARLGATIVQPCIITLEPVTTRIETDVIRHFVADWQEPSEDEVEMPEDDSREPLSPEVDLARLLEEALALNLPLYPRADGAELGPALFAEPGVEPLSDDDLKPFAGLAELRGKLSED